LRQAPTGLGGWSRVGCRSPRRRPVIARALRLAAAALTGLGTLSPAQTGSEVVTDENLDDAIRRAVAWIQSQRNPDGHWESASSRTDLHWAGNSALAILSLLYAGQDLREESMARSLDWLAAQTLNGTYTYATRAHALALVGVKSYGSRLEEDLNWLLKAVGSRGSPGAGAYDYYGAPKPGSWRWDHSVSQFGVLGVWMSAEAGLNVPEWYWDLVGQHWMDWQNSDGGWGYQNHDRSTGSMTAAGVCTLFVVLDQRYADRPKDSQARALAASVEQGLRWLDREFGPESLATGGEWRYYYLYGLERAARASGYKYLGQKDWFAQAAEYLLEQQREDGSWPGTGGWMSPLRNTAFALMVLCHGRAPLLFNKLQYSGDWDGRPRDLAGLARYAGRTLERLFNWQIVRLDGPSDDLFDAPVLYVYGESPYQFDDVETQKIREYCLRGGMILGLAGRNSPEFLRSLESLARRALPDYPLRPLAREHALLAGHVHFPIGDPPPMLEVHNGLRTLMLFCAHDLAEGWCKPPRRERTDQDLQLGVNIYLICDGQEQPTDPPADADYSTQEAGNRPDHPPGAHPVRRPVGHRTLRLDAAGQLSAQRGRGQPAGHRRSAAGFGGTQGVPGSTHHRHRRFRAVAA